MGWGAKAPKAPDYKAQAEATAKANQQAQTQADWANRPTVETPWGTESWTTEAVVDPATGATVNKWVQKQTLNPQQQAALDSQMAIQQGKSDLAQQQMGRVNEALASPFDWDNLQAYGNVNQQNISADPYMTQGAGQGLMRGLDPSLFGDAGRQRYENALFERMAPQHQRAQSALDAKLSNMGATVGGRGWQAMQQNLGDQQSRERFNALEMGGQEQQRQFNMALGGGQFQNAAQQQAWQQMLGQNAQNFGLMSGANQQNFGQNMQLANYQNQLRQQQIAEQQLRRQMPLNEMNALLTGQQVQGLNTPNFNTSRSAGGADYSGAAGQQYGAAQDAYNVQQSNQQGLMSGVATIGAAAMIF